MLRAFHELRFDTDRVFLLIVCEIVNQKVKKSGKSVNNNLTSFTMKFRILELSVNFSTESHGIFQ